MSTLCASGGGRFRFVGSPTCHLANWFFYGCDALGIFARLRRDTMNPIFHKCNPPLPPKHSMGRASLFIEPMECCWSINGQRDIVATFVGHTEAERLQRIDLLAHPIGVFVRHLSPLCHGRQVA